MTALNKYAALREAAEKASTDNHTQDEWFHYLRCSHPATVLTLLDELEAKDKSIGFLKDQLAQLANFNPDWDRLEAATDSLREHMAKLSAAEKRIAELEAREQKNLAEERQRVIDGLCTIGETAWEIDEYMKEWDAKHLRKAASAGIGVKGE